MELYSLKIEGFRRHFNTEIIMSDATFLIGSNNLGKSTIFRALDFLLNDKRKVDKNDFFSILGKNDDNEQIASTIRLTAVFRNIPQEAKNWKGFNAKRLFTYKSTNEKDTGLEIHYRKTYDDKSCKIEMKQHKVTLKENYMKCKTLQDFINAGLEESIATSIFKDKKPTENVTKMIRDLEDEGIDEIFDTNTSEEIWFENPGGIAGNVISRLPKFLLIPDRTKTEELSGNNGALIKTLNSLFEDIRDASENFKKAQHYLNLLASELNPNDETSDFFKMLKDLNRVVGDVFPDTSFLALANLSNASDVITPKFDIKLGSNINTTVENQGAGVIRSAIFAMLRYRSMRENRKKKGLNEYIRPLLIAFEEPEIYLHPKAAQQMRDTIYDLACDSNNQIIATTHSPYMIDLSKKSSQVLNCLTLADDILEHNGEEISIKKVEANPFNVTKVYTNLIEEDKNYLKMLLKIDDSIAKVFFTKKVLIIEGDTEEVVIKETISRMPSEYKKEVLYNWEIVKARGKATIISLVRYLKALGIHPFVIHDMDSDKANASKFNEPIVIVLGDRSKRVMLENCIEDILGYKAPTNEKPFKAFSFIKSNWGEDWNSITPQWRNIMEKIFFGKENHATSINLQEVAVTKEE
ncbi:AAA family ATPase [Fictibacillus sp. NRS-1165]|uniref:AAA family ATPase n=1 Tax=Fictibacillus sp. NRS-1165 TaxID=3144463 RepID=UPI003D210F6E